MKNKNLGKCNGNNDNGCFLESSGHDCGCFVKENNITKDQKDDIIKEYLKDKVWEGSELQIRFSIGDWIDYDSNQKIQFRLKKYPAYSKKEIEFMLKEFKKHGQKVTIKFE